MRSLLRDSSKLSRRSIPNPLRWQTSLSQATIAAHSASFSLGLSCSPFAAHSLTSQDAVQLAGSPLFQFITLWYIAIHEVISLHAISPLVRVRCCHLDMWFKYGGSGAGPRQPCQAA